MAAFQGNFSPAGDTTLPYTITISLNVNGSMSQSGIASQKFNLSSDNQSLAFSAPFTVSSVPAAVSIQSLGGPFSYNTTGLTIYRLGDLS